MGYLTTIVLHNDAMGSFKKDPKHFGEKVLECIENANQSHRETDIGFLGYCNYITAHPSRHADDTTVFVHYGNTVFNLNPYGTEFKELLERNPDILEPFISNAEWIVRQARKLVNDSKKLKKSE